MVIPNTAEDVVAAVQFAADHCLKVAARGTGHQLAGLALAQDGMTINMAAFQNISFDPATNIAYVQVPLAPAEWPSPAEEGLALTTMCAQMGLSSGSVDSATLPYNRLPIAGTCNHVGVAGFTLHGGNGWSSMWHGAAADFVQSLDVVVVGWVLWVPAHALFLLDPHGAELMCPALFAERMARRCGRTSLHSRTLTSSLASAGRAATWAWRWPTRLSPFPRRTTCSPAFTSSTLMRHPRCSAGELPDLPACWAALFVAPFPTASMLAAGGRPSLRLRL